MSAAEESLEESCEATVVGRLKGLATKPFLVSSPSLDAGEVTDRVTNFVGLSEPASGLQLGNQSQIARAAELVEPCCLATSIDPTRTLAQEASISPKL